MAQSFTQHVAARRALCCELCALNPYFSQRLRADTGPDVSPPRMAKRHGRRASRSRRGIKDRLRGIDDEKERTIAVTQWATTATTTTTTREGNARDTRACLAGKETIVPVVHGRQLYSRRKIVSTHARARDANRAHGRAHGADMRERNADNGPDCKIWNDFVGARVT